MTLNRILETSLYVTDIDTTVEFYEKALGLTLHSRHEGRHAFFRCGRGMLLLFVADVTNRQGGHVPPHGTRGAGHVAFAVSEGELEKWRIRLQNHGVEIEADVSWGDAGQSLYFRDPSGNSLEITTPGIWGIAE